MGGPGQEGGMCGCRASGECAGGFSGRIGEVGGHLAFLSPLAAIAMDPCDVSGRDSGGAWKRVGESGMPGEGVHDDSVPWVVARGQRVFGGFHVHLVPRLGLARSGASADAES